MSTIFNKTILKFCLLGVLDRFMLIYSVYIMFFAKIGLNPMMLGAVLATYEFGKIFGDPIFASLGDKHGKKTLIIYGFAFKGLGVLSWVLFPGIASSFVGVLFIGAGKSGTNNIDSYMYDEFKSNDIANKFEDAIALKSIFTNLSASCGGFFASILYKKGGFDAVFLSSAVIIFCVSIPYILFALNDSKSYVKENKNISILSIVKNGLSCTKADNNVLFSVVMTAIFYSVYIIMTDTNKMVMNDIGFTPDFIARIYAIAHIIPAITTAVFLIIRPDLMIGGVVTLSIVIWISISVISFNLYGQPLIASILMFLFMFPIFDVCLKDQMQKVIPSELRSTINSFSHLISSFFNIIFSLTIGFIANNYSYQHAMTAFPIMISIFTISIMVYQKSKYKIIL